MARTPAGQLDTSSEEEGTPGEVNAVFGDTRNRLLAQKVSKERDRRGKVNHVFGDTGNRLLAQ